MRAVWPSICYRQIIFYFFPMAKDNSLALIVAVVAVTGLVLVVSNSNTAAVSYEPRVFDAPSHGGTYVIPGDIWDQGKDAGVQTAQECTGAPEYSSCCRDSCRMLSGDILYRNMCISTCKDLWSGHIN